MNILKYILPLYILTSNKSNFKPFKGIKALDFKKRNILMYKYLLSNFNKSELLIYYLAILNVESNGDFYRNQLRYESSYCKNYMNNNTLRLLNNYGINCNNYASAGISQILPDNFLYLMKNKININHDDEIYDIIYKYGIIAGYYFFKDRYRRYKKIEFAIRSYNGNPYNNITKIYYNSIKFNDLTA